MTHEHGFPFRVLITVSSLTAIALAALAVGQTEIAALAAGGAVGYLGKVNGSPSV